MRMRSDVSARYALPALSPNRSLPISSRRRSRWQSRADGRGRTAVPRASGAMGGRSGAQPWWATFDAGRWGFSLVLLGPSTIGYDDDGGGEIERSELHDHFEARSSG